MIGQYLPQINENATVANSKKKIASKQSPRHSVNHCEPLQKKKSLLVPMSCLTIEPLVIVNPLCRFTIQVAKRKMFFSVPMSYLTIKIKNGVHFTSAPQT